MVDRFFNVNGLRPVTHPLISVLVFHIWISVVCTRDTHCCLPSGNKLFAECLLPSPLQKPSRGCVCGVNSPQNRVYLLLKKKKQTKMGPKIKGYFAITLVTSVMRSEWFLVIIKHWWPILAWRMGVEVQYYKSKRLPME